MHFIRQGSGKPILLVHGLGATWRSWEPILPGLQAQREVIAVDLPGFGETPPLPGEVSIATLADALTSFLREQHLLDVDTVGSSMGARLVLELVRRAVGGTAVALDPGGFWSPGERRFFGLSVRASIGLVRRLQPILPVLTGNAVGRTLLLSQFSARPWALPADLVLRELRGYAHSPSLDAALDSLIHGPTQGGAPSGTFASPVIIGWGRQDRVCLPRQAARAKDLFPDATVHWFDKCGHFPMWDQPKETLDLVLRSTA